MSEPRVGYRYSRRAAGPTTFGLRGRLVLTVVVTVGPVSVLSLAGPFGILAVMTWLVVMLPLVLRDVWRRTPVAVLQPPAPPRPTCAPPPPGEYVGPTHPGRSRW